MLDTLALSKGRTFQRVELFPKLRKGSLTNSNLFEDRTSYLSDPS